MKFSSKLIPATLIRRYKRFFVEAKLEHGEIITAHTANTGPMTSCFEEGRTAYFSYHDDPKRKLKYSLELIQTNQTLIGVNTHLANVLVREAIENGIITELASYKYIVPEFKIGDSRLDFMLSNSHSPECFVEVKSVTLLGDNKTVLFPDTVTTRGQKHLRELINLKKQGYRTIMLFVVQREDVDKFAPAHKIDYEYARLLKEAHQNNVEVFVYCCKLKLDEIKVTSSLGYSPFAF